MSTLEQTRRSLPIGTWAADPVHSDVGFRVDYMAGTFAGTFSKFSIQAADGALEGEAEVASVQVKDPNLETHLQSPDFFDAERHPTIAFGASEITRSGDEVTVAGEVTIKGHTEPVELRGTISEPIADPFGNERFGLKLETAIDRTAFGVSWNNPLPSGEQALANKVTLFAELQLIKTA